MVDVNRFIIKYEDLEFDQELARGNFGKVSKGTYLGTTVAIKELFFVDDDFMQKYIEREMQTLIQLSHPNIVQLLGICITSDVFIVTEFIDGGNLRKNLASRKSIPMNWDLRLTLGSHVSLAMIYLHEKHNMMHRDLKSANILVDKSGDKYIAKVCDFGLAREDNAQDEQGGNSSFYTVVGTTEWMAPEVALGREYSKSADVFSFGVILWELATRKRPPMRKPPQFKFTEDLFKPKLPADTPPGLWELMLSCCQQFAEDRPTFSEVHKQLVDIISKLPAAEAHVPQPSAPSHAEPKAEKKPKDLSDDEEKKAKEEEHEDMNNWAKDSLEALRKDEDEEDAEHEKVQTTTDHDVNGPAKVLNRSMAKQGKIIEEVSKKFFITSKPLLLRVEIPDTTFSPGQTVEVNVKIKNHGKTVCKALRLVVMSIRKKSKKNEGNPKYYKETSFPMSGPNEWIETLSVKLPDRMRIDKETSHQLQVELTVRNHSTVKLAVPLNIHY